MAMNRASRTSHMIFLLMVHHLLVSSIIGLYLDSISNPHTRVYDIVKDLPNVLKQKQTEKRKILPMKPSS